jgi:response regulator RpfG family c-di-GMP phosphodiesterase
MLEIHPFETIGETRGSGSGRHRLLIVDDEPANRALCRKMLETVSTNCDEAGDGEAALNSFTTNRYDLILLDIDMPKMNGKEVLRKIREKPPSPHLKVIMLSGRASGDEMAQLMRAGADDFLSKPFSGIQLRERVKAALRLKDAQEREDLSNRRMRAVNRELELTLTARDSDLADARNALVLSLAELVATRDTETGGHLLRLQHYCQCLAQESARLPTFCEVIDSEFISLLACCAPLHDIGKVGIPDRILQKPGKLTAEERKIMETHTVIAAEVLQKVARKHSGAIGFLHMAIDVARHHHERFDGTGYPDRLVGDQIPLAARIVAVADVYDALRSPRSYKPGFSHTEAVKIMMDELGHFDPALLEVFRSHCTGAFERLYSELTD